jgi:predicted enzyme related to lactoylglutathione lyase
MTSGSVEGIAGVMLWTSAERFAAMRRFYVEQVGLTPDPSRRSDHVAFSWGEPPRHVRLIVGVHEGVSGPSHDPDRVMVNLLVSDIEPLAEAMAARGVVLDQPPTAMSWGGWIATFRDPDGNTVQLLQPA